jgi:hypothetical protein
MSDVMALLGFLGLLVLLVARMRREQHSQNNQDLPKAGNSFTTTDERRLHSN